MSKRAGIQGFVKEAVSYLYNNLSWMECSNTKQKFCWKLIATCCSVIKSSSENFEFVLKYREVVDQLVIIYNVCVIEHRCTVILTEEFPPEIAAISNEDITE